MFVVRILPQGNIWTMDARGLAEYVLHNTNVSRIDFEPRQITLHMVGAPLSMDQKISWVQSYLGITMGCCG
jgi:hypothetical protein